VTITIPIGRATSAPDWTPTPPPAAVAVTPSPGIPATPVSVSLVTSHHLNGQLHPSNIISIEVLYGIMGILLLPVLNKEKASRLSGVLVLRHEEIVNLSDFLEHVPELFLWGRKRVVPDDDFGQRVI
jgi:hypothetical protein